MRRPRCRDSRHTRPQLLLWPGRRGATPQGAGRAFRCGICCHRTGLACSCCVRVWGCGLVLLVTTPHPTFIPRVGTNVVCWNGRQTMRQTHQASPASRRTRKRLVKEIKKEHRPARAADLDRSSPAECSADCCLASCSHQRPADGTSPAARPSVLSVATVQAAGRGCCSSVKGHAARLVCVTTLLACSERLTCALVRSLVCRTRGAAQTVS